VIMTHVWKTVLKASGRRLLRLMWIPSRSLVQPSSWDDATSVAEHSISMCMESECGAREVRTLDHRVDDISNLMIVCQAVQRSHHTREPSDPRDLSITTLLYRASLRVLTSSQSSRQGLCDDKWDAFFVPSIRYSMNAIVIAHISFVLCYFLLACL
jgi:hypothetical protein